jgi:urease accessory protein
MRPPLSLLTPAAQPTERPRAAAEGRLRFSRVGGSTCITGCFATAPLKLLPARPRGTSAWVFASSFGGGLVAGDHIAIDVSADANARCLVSTQSATKVYRSPHGTACRQDVTARVGAHALLAWLPDPVSCFAGSVYEQVQRFELASGASLMLLDWLISGRKARGERWAFSRYRSRNHVFVADEHVLADAMLLDSADGPIDSPFRLGRFDSLATLVLLGPLLSDAAGQILERASREPVTHGASLIASASPLRDGVVLRLLAQETESSAHYLRSMLGDIAALLGEDPWTRKW